MPKFTDIKCYDPVVREHEFTHRYRNDLLQFELHNLQDKLAKLSQEIEELKSDLYPRIDDNELLSALKDKLQQLKNNRASDTASRITNKLNRLYQGVIFLPEAPSTYLNLSSHALTHEQEQVLNLGTKCHYKPKIDPMTKKVEMELLYESFLKLNNDEKVYI